MVTNLGTIKSALKAKDGIGSQGQGPLIYGTIGYGSSYGGSGERSPSHLTVGMPYSNRARQSSTNNYNSRPQQQQQQILAKPSRPASERHWNYKNGKMERAY